MTERLDVSFRPPLQGHGYRGGYRLYTPEFVDFDAVPPYGDGGPATVAVGGWGISYMNASRDAVSAGLGKCELGAHRPEDGGRSFEKHELNGGLYDSIEDAARAAYNAGILAIMVFEEYGSGPSGNFCSIDMDAIRAGLR